MNRDWDKDQDRDQDRDQDQAVDREAGGRLIGGVWGAEPPQGKIKF